MLTPRKTTLRISSSLSIIAILVIALLTSVGMQTNAAAQNTVFQEQIRGRFARAFESIEEGNIGRTYLLRHFKLPQVR
jgi:hypothetical protein